MTRVSSHAAFLLALIGLCLGFSHKTTGLQLVQHFSNQSQVSCKAQNFSVFFKNYTESIALQKQCIQTPLKKLMLIEDEDDLKPILKIIPPEQLTYPLILSTKQKAEQNLYLKIEISNNKKAKVTYFKPDTGYKIIYRFQSKKNHWHLIKIEDWSI
jgi:hypothetical protein